MQIRAQGTFLRSGPSIIPAVFANTQFVDLLLLAPDFRSPEELQGPILYNYIISKVGVPGRTTTKGIQNFCGEHDAQILRGASRLPEKFLNIPMRMVNKRRIVLPSEHSPLMKSWCAKWKSICR